MSLSPKSAKINFNLNIHDYEDQDYVNQEKGTKKYRIQKINCNVDQFLKELKQKERHHQETNFLEQLRKKQLDSQRMVIYQKNYQEQVVKKLNNLVKEKKLDLRPISGKNPINHYKLREIQKSLCLPESRSVSTPIFPSTPKSVPPMSPNQTSANQNIFRVSKKSNSLHETYQKLLGSQREKQKEHLEKQLLEETLEREKRVLEAKKKEYMARQRMKKILNGEQKMKKMTKMLINNFETLKSQRGRPYTDAQAHLIRIFDDKLNELLAVMNQNSTQEITYPLISSHLRQVSFEYCLSFQRLITGQRYTQEIHLNGQVVRKFNEQLQKFLLTIFDLSLPQDKRQFEEIARDWMNFQEQKFVVIGEKWDQIIQTHHRSQELINTLTSRHRLTLSADEKNELQLTFCHLLEGDTLEVLQAIQTHKVDASIYQVCLLKHDLYRFFQNIRISHENLLLVLANTQTVFRSLFSHYFTLDSVGVRNLTNLIIRLGTKSLFDQDVPVLMVQKFLKVIIDYLQERISSEQLPSLIKNLQITLDDKLLDFLTDQIVKNIPRSVENPHWFVRQQSFKIGMLRGQATQAKIIQELKNLYQNDKRKAYFDFLLENHHHSIFSVFDIITLVQDN